MKRILAALAIFVMVIAAVIFLVPSLRLSLVGARLSHALQPRSQDTVNALSLLSTGTEIRSLTEEGLTVPTLNARPATYDLRLGLQETVQSIGAEEMLDYRVMAVHSEQLGTSGGRDLTGNSYRMRGWCTGLPVELSQRDGQASKVLDLAGFSQLLAAWWPALPRTLARPGATWTGRWEVPLDLGLLKDAQVVMQHRLNYTLVDFTRERDLLVARIQVTGNLVPQARGQVPAGAVVTGTGRVEGTALVDLATGRTVLADDRTAWSVVLRLPAEKIEVVHFSDRKSRLWRPRLVPDGHAGFKSTLPMPGGSAPEPGAAAAPVGPAAAPTGPTVPAAGTPAGSAVAPGGPATQAATPSPAR